MKQNGLALVGALGGAILGYFAFFWIASQGFYALVLPGALLGLGAGLVKNNSIALCIACGGLALVTGTVTEWRFAPFVKDRSALYFFTHLHQLQPITLIMLAAGAFIGFWVPFRRRDLEKRSTNRV